MKQIIDLIKKNSQILLYLIFGGLTTLVNLVVYVLCFDIVKVPNVPSTIAAWLAAVLFAYVTNKLLVFRSKSFEKQVFVKELLSFFGCRILTGALDVAIMYVSVDLLSGNAALWKLLSNVAVVVLNYIASKLVIFRNKN